MNVIFRPATPADAAAVHAVTRAAFTGGPPLEPPSGAVSETVDDVAADLAGPASPASPASPGGVIGEVDGTAVAALRLRTDGRVVWLRRVAVVPGAQRRTIGARLVTWTHAHLAWREVEEMRVGVRTARPGARQFWERLGYVEGAAHDYWHELTRPPAYAAAVGTAAQMRALGARLAAALAPGDLVLCSGGLGAGKTTFAQGLGAALGVRGAVTSPTFVLARRHPPAHAGGLALVHVDTYRLGGVDDPLAEVDALDLDSELADAVTLVEWGEGLVESLSHDRVEVRISRATDTDSDERRVVVDALGPRWAAGRDLRARLRDDG